jgi:hypothetical protein
MIMNVPLWLLERAEDPNPNAPNDPTSHVQVCLEANCRWRSVSATSVVPASWLPWNRPRKRKI